MTYFTDTLFYPPSKVTRLEIQNGECASTLLERGAGGVECDVTSAKAVVECGIAFFALKRLHGTLCITYRGADCDDHWVATFTIKGKSNVLELSFCVNDALVSHRSFVTPMTAIQELRNYTAMVCDEFEEY